MKNTAFYIATRYLLAKKGSTAVTFITWLAALAMMVAVTAMFIIISVFSGLEDLNKDLIANLHSDITLKSKEGNIVTLSNESGDFLIDTAAASYFKLCDDEDLF